MNDRSNRKSEDAANGPPGGGPGAEGAGRSDQTKFPDATAAAGASPAQASPSGEGAEDAPVIEGVTIAYCIGTGGQGSVYRGHQNFLQRSVAVKVLHPQVSQDLGRFRREAQYLAKLQHPNIVAIYQAGVTERNRCFMVLELVDGMDLSDYVKDYGALKEETALSITLDAARGLQYGYEQVQRFIHRDVKPQNILLEMGGGVGTPRAKLVDLGLARCLDDSFELTVAGQVMGTPISMAPEQFNSPDDVDHRTDIYGLGCVLYFALTGDKAFRGRTLTELRQNKEEATAQRYQRIQASAATRALLARMLEPKQEDRPGSYGELIDAIEAALGSVGEEPAPTGRGKGRLWAGVTAAVLVAGGGAAFFLNRGGEPDPGPDPDPRPSPVTPMPSPQVETVKITSEVPDETFETSLRIAGDVVAPDGLPEGFVLRCGTDVVAVREDLSFSHEVQLDPGPNALRFAWMDGTSGGGFEIQINRMELEPPPPPAPRVALLEPLGPEQSLDLTSSARWAGWWRTSAEVGEPLGDDLLWERTEGQITGSSEPGDEEGFFWSDRDFKVSEVSISQARPFWSPSASSISHQLPGGEWGLTGRLTLMKAGFEDHLVGGLRLGRKGGGWLELAMVVTIEDAMRGDASGFTRGLTAIWFDADGEPSSFQDDAPFKEAPRIVEVPPEGRKRMFFREGSGPWKDGDLFVLDFRLARSGDELRITLGPGLKLVVDVPADLEERPFDELSLFVRQGRISARALEFTAPGR